MAVEITSRSITTKVWGGAGIKLMTSGSVVAVDSLQVAL